MTTHPDEDPGARDAAVRAPEHGLRVLTEAAQALRVHTPSGWRAVRADLLERVRRGDRPSAPVRGRHELGEFVLASDVLVGALREAVDALPAVTATSVTCTTGAGDLLERVAVEVAVVFGEHLPSTAQRVRAAVGARLGALLGTLSPGAAGVEVHVHVGDVVALAAELGRPAG